LLARNAWEKRKLSEVTNLITKGTTPREKGGRGEVNFIKVENLSKNGNIFTTSKVSVSEYQGYLARSILQENDILFSIAGSLGRTAIVPKLVLPANTNQALAIIRLSTGCVEFVATYLSGEAIDRYIRRNPTVGAQPNISLTQVASLQIDWPSLHEQEVISKLFARVKDLIAATQDKIDALEQAKRALLQRLFDQSWRFKGYSDPWEKRKLGETNSYFTDGNYGESYPKESELSDKENGVPFLRGSNLRNGELIEDNANYITKEKHAELTSGHLVEDDIVLAVRGSLGALGYVKEENIDWNINSQLAVIRTDKSELSGKFLAQFLLSWRGQKELLSRNTGTALKQLPIKQLKDVPVPIVNLDEQKEISALFTSIDNLIAATQSRLSSLELLKKALLQDLFI
jgi:type I restriction enzyme S subunit